MKNLSLRVHAKNELNKIVLSEVNNLIPQLQKYVGLKFVNADGSITKKTPVMFLKNNCIPFNSGHASTQYCYIECTGYNLILKISLCFNGGSYDEKTAYTLYVKESVYVGELLNGNVLKSTYSIENIVRDYNLNGVVSVEEEQNKFTEYKKLIEKADQIKRSIRIDYEEYELR